jgi:hypothetical protein
MPTPPLIIYLQATPAEGQENLTLQSDATKDWCNAAAGPGVKVDIVNVLDDICEDRESYRPGLDETLTILESDPIVEMLIVWSVQKLGFSVSQILPSIERIAQSGKQFRTLTTFPATDGAVQDFKLSHYKFKEGFFD